MRISKGDKKMKKLASIVLVIAMLFVLSISAFAEVSHQNIPVTDDMQGENSYKYSGGEDISGSDNDLANGVAQNGIIPVTVNESTEIQSNANLYAWYVDIFWEDMTFTCKKTTTANGWNPDTRQYTADDKAASTYEWSTDAHNEIDVENDSNHNITVGLSFKSAIDGVTGEFYVPVADNTENPTQIVTTKTIYSEPAANAANASLAEGQAEYTYHQEFYFRFNGNLQDAAAKIFAATDANATSTQVGTITVTITGSTATAPVS
jgi:hypothetical protein